MNINLRAYLRVFKTEFIAALAYKFEFLVWAILHPIILIIQYFVWHAVYTYTGTGAIASMTFTQMVSYFVFNSVFDRWVWVDKAVERDVRYGNCVVLFLKPIKYFFFRLASEIGERSVAALLHMLPTLIFGIIFLNFGMTNLIFTALGVLSALLSWLISFIWAFTFGLTTYWTKRYKGTHAIKRSIEWVLAGEMIPIVFFPILMQKILMLTPLPYISFVPPMIFLGKYTVIESIKLIGMQIFWIFALYLFWKLLFKKAYKKFTGVGV